MIFYFCAWCFEPTEDKTESVVFPFPDVLLFPLYLSSYLFFSKDVFFFLKYLLEVIQ